MPSLKSKHYLKLLLAFMVPLLIFISIGVNFEAANSVQSELENIGIQLDNSAFGAHREKVCL